MNAGDLLLLASGRCYHRVTPVSGASRVTMGGFLALDKARERVLHPIWPTNGSPADASAPLRLRVPVTRAVT